MSAFAPSRSPTYANFGSAPRSSGAKASYMMPPAPTWDPVAGHRMAADAERKRNDVLRDTFEDYYKNLTPEAKKTYAPAGGQSFGTIHSVGPAGTIDQTMDTTEEMTRQNARKDFVRRIQMGDFATRNPTYQNAYDQANSAYSTARQNVLQGGPGIVPPMTREDAMIKQQELRNQGAANVAQINKSNQPGPIQQGVTSFLGGVKDFATTLVKAGADNNRTNETARHNKEMEQIERDRIAANANKPQPQLTPYQQQQLDFHRNKAYQDLKANIERYSGQMTPEQDQELRRSLGIVSDKTGATGPSATDIMGAAIAQGPHPSPTPNPPPVVAPPSSGPASQPATQPTTRPTYLAPDQALKVASSVKPPANATHVRVNQATGGIEFLDDNGNIIPAKMN